MVAINTIGTKHASSTEATNDAVHQLLDYLATYPDDGILYRASDMILVAQSDAGFHNESKGHSWAGAHIFLSEDDSIPHWNGPILTVDQIIKFVLASAVEAELRSLFITAQKMVPLQQTLIEMGWPQKPSPGQSNNTTSEGVANGTIVANKLKSTDLRLHWLRCREARNQFHFYWYKGPNNWADHSNKHHPPVLY